MNNPCRVNSRLKIVKVNMLNCIMSLILYIDVKISLTIAALLVVIEDFSSTWTFNVKV
jgi:hypothetical protein